MFRQLICRLLAEQPFVTVKDEIVDKWLNWMIWFAETMVTTSSYKHDCMYTYGLPISLRF